MPLDPPKHHQDRRRLARDPIAAVRQDGMYSREIEMERNRGEISCAECRRCLVPHTPLLALSHALYVPTRLKIKCDKQIPCQSCQVCPTQQFLMCLHLTFPTKRRGCASLCPNGLCSLPLSGSVSTTLNVPSPLPPR